MAVSRQFRYASIQNMMQLATRVSCEHRGALTSACNHGDKEYAFEVNGPTYRFGRGVTREAGYDLESFGATKTMVLTDSNLATLPTFKVLLDTLSKHKLPFEVFDRVQIEPTEASVREAVEFAKAGGFDAFVAFGGGSTMDTGKFASLYVANPTADLFDFVVKPYGKNLEPPNRIKPLICIPTSAGTASECTSIAIFGISDGGGKTGVRKHKIKPTLALVDAENVMTMPANVAAYTAFDQLLHAAESYTLLPFSERTPRPAKPSERPVNQGRNPMSDTWALQGLKLLGESIVKSVREPDNFEARQNSLLASSMAGLGFGNAGVHLPHALSYPIAGQVKSFMADGYPQGKPLVPHGLAVMLTAPADFEFTGPASPERHLEAARILGCNTSNAKLADAGIILADKLREIMVKLGVPNGLKAIGFDSGDMGALAEGAMAGKSALQLCPRQQTQDEIQELYEKSFVNY